MKNTIPLRWIALWIILFIGQNPLKAQEIEDIKSTLATQEYDEASLLIDRLLDKPGEAAKSESWYYRGLIYSNIVDDVRGGADLDSLALFKSYSSYLNAISLATDFYADSAKVRLDSLYTTALNYAGRQYQKALDLRRVTVGEVKRNSNLYGYYRSAIDAAKIAQELSPQDTLAYNISYLAAYEIQDYDTYIKSLEQMAILVPKLDQKYNYYQGAIDFCTDVLNDKAQAVRILNDAIAIFPDSTHLRDALLNLTVQEGDQQQILEQAKNQVTLNPNDPVSYYNLAVIYQQIGNNVEAIHNYQTCIQIDSTNFEANFNLGGTYFNQGAQYLKQINISKDFTFTDYHKRGKELEAKANQDLTNALPYFKRCERLDPSNVQVLQALHFIYKRLNNVEELLKIQRKLEYLNRSYANPQQPLKSSNKN